MLKMVVFLWLKILNFKPNNLHLMLNNRREHLSDHLFTSFVQSSKLLEIKSISHLFWDHWYGRDGVCCFIRYNDVLWCVPVIYLVRYVASKSEVWVAGKHYYISVALLIFGTDFGDTVWLCMRVGEGVGNDAGPMAKEECRVSASTAEECREQRRVQGAVTHWSISNNCLWKVIVSAWFLNTLICSV